MESAADKAGLTDRLSSQIDEFRQLCLVQVHEFTKRRKVSHLIHFIETEYLFDVRQFSSKLIQLHLNQMATKGCSFSTIGCRRAALNQFCEYLVQIEELSESPCAHVKNPAQRKRKLPHFLTDEQMDRVYNYAVGIPIAADSWTLYEPILLAAKTGITVNEIQQIQWNYFDFCGKLLTTYRPKTQKSRTIPLHHKIIEVFEPRQEQDGYVFRGPNGGSYYSASTWQRWINPIQEKLPWLWGYHDFRRTFAVKLGKAGVPPVEIMHYLGHANLETTMRYMNYAPSNYNANIEHA